MGHDVLPRRSTGTWDPTEVVPVLQRPTNDCYSNLSRSRIQASTHRQPIQTIANGKRQSLVYLAV